MNFREFWTLILEGGTGGHMSHPFDLPFVKSGKDLIKLFYDTDKSLAENKTGAVKIDGVNSSTKVVERNGKKQFALDRGGISMANAAGKMDIPGVTVDELGQRFPEGHGFLDIGKRQLEALNEALPKTKPELKALGMLDNPNIIMNMECVLRNPSGKTNTVQYKFDFLAIHGLKKTVMSEDGKKRAIVDAPTNQDAIDSFVVKARPILEKHGFYLFGSETPEKKPAAKTDLEAVLNSSLTFVTSKGKETKTLKQWLEGASNPIGKRITLASPQKNPRDGKELNEIGAISQTGYWLVFEDKIPLTKLVKPEDEKDLIDGSLMFYATKVLGQKIKEAYTSKLGDISEHEGIVVRDKDISDVPYKITGNFMAENITGSSFKAKE